MARNASQNSAKRAVGYVRVSTEEQATEGVSLDVQRARISDHRRLHEHRLVEVHADEGRSAKRTDNRPGLAAALDQACSCSGVLVVYSLSRLARSTRDAIEITERLEQAGADLVSITERIDTTTGIGRFFFTTMAALAQLERDQISERTTAALAHKRHKKQRVSGQIPFGYDLADDGVHLVVNRGEQGAIRRIRRLRQTGMSSRNLIAELERQGITPKGCGRWHPKVILQLCGRSA